MINKASSRNRFLTLALGVTLGLAAVLTVLLLVVPEKAARSVEAQGIALFGDGESRYCSVSLEGTMRTYTFDKDAPLYEGTLLVDGLAVGDLFLTFDGDYAAPKEDGVPAVLTKDLAIAAQVTLDGRDCLVLAPAPDEAAAQTLLAQFLADTVFARRCGWEAYQSE